MIEDAVYTLLKNDVQLGTLLSADSVFLMEKPGDREPDHYIVHHLLDAQTPLAVDLTTDGSSCLYRVQCYSVDAQRSRNIAARVVALFNGGQFDVDGFLIELSQVTGSVPGIDSAGVNGGSLHSVAVSLQIYYQ